MQRQINGLRKHARNTKMRFYILFFFLAIYLSYGQYEIKISYLDLFSKSNHLDVRFTNSRYADLDIRFVESEYSADFTVGFTNTKSKANIAVTNSSSADLNVSLIDAFSGNADLDVRITNNSSADLDIMIKKSGTVDYLIYSHEFFDGEDYMMDKEEIIVACLPIIKCFKDDLNAEKIPLYIEDCGSVVTP